MDLRKCQKKPSYSKFDSDILWLKPYINFVLSSNEKKVLKKIQVFNIKPPRVQRILGICERIGRGSYAVRLTLIDHVTFNDENTGELTIGVRPLDDEKILETLAHELAHLRRAVRKDKKWTQHDDEFYIESTKILLKFYRLRKKINSK